MVERSSGAASQQSRMTMTVDGAKPSWARRLAAHSIGVRVTVSKKLSCAVFSSRAPSYDRLGVRDQDDLAHRVFVSGLPLIRWTLAGAVRLGELAGLAGWT
jgi:hypothetical protein